MARLARVAWIALLLPAIGWSQPARNAATGLHEASRPTEPKLQSRHYGLPRGVDRFGSDDADRSLFAGVKVAPNGSIGLGMFGLKAQPSYGAPVTNREIDHRRSRRAGVGFSLKF